MQSGGRRQSGGGRMQSGGGWMQRGGGRMQGGGGRFSLQPCSSSSNSSNRDPLLAERLAVAGLENVRVGSRFSMMDLEVCFQHAVSAVTRIMLASIIEQALGEPFEESADEISGMAENDALCQQCNSELVCNVDVPLVEVRAWVTTDTYTRYQAQILSRFSRILETVRHDYEYPCSPRNYEGNGFATWAELRVAAEKFMSHRNPSLSDCLELILFLRKRPYLDMTVNARPSMVEDDISVFDSKMDRLRLKYPIVDKVTDPALVIIEPVGGAPTPPQPAAIIATMGTATIPSNIEPVNLPDPAGLAGSTFDHVFQVANIAEARTFAALLRVALADANLVGGNGPPTRILVVNSPAAAFRVY